MSKTKMVNIGGDEKDAAYRYKMPALVTKVEGRGNGIKTILVNITDVCKHMHTEPQYATRFFGIECGAVSKWDDKRDAGIVHGVHERNELQKMLKKFVREFILCPKCNLPELQMKVQTKKSFLMIRCGACGHKGKNNSTHNVKKYIINHPPTSRSKGGLSKSKNKDKKNKNAASQSGDSKESQNDLSKQTDIDQLGGANDEIWTVDISDEAVARRKHDEMKTFANSNTNEKKETKEDENNNSKNNEEEEDDDEDDPDAKQASKLDPYRSTTNKIDENESSGPAQILRGFMSEKNRNMFEILDEIKRLGLAHSLDDAKRFKVTFEATCKFDTAKKFIQSLNKNIELFIQLNKKNKDSLIFFGCLEEIIARRNPDLLLPKTYMILEAIYDLEIASEEQILSWYNTESDKTLLLLRDEAEQVRKMAKPFITWLEEADEDDDEEDDDDEDDTIDIE